MPQTITEAFDKCVRENSDRPALNHKVNDTWQAITWKMYGNRVNLYSRALMAQGVASGDMVAIIGANSTEWFFTDMAVMTMGAVSVPIYGTSSGEQIKYILNHSGSKVFVVDNIFYFQKIETVLGDIPGLKRVVVLKGEVPEGKDILIDFASFERSSEEVALGDLMQMKNSVKSDDMATLIYTSGTTGPPKAVILTHKNCITAARNVNMTIGIKGEIISCCYLPLSHVADRCINLFTRLMDGGTVYFIESYNKFLDYLREIRPTLWAGVPRVWEKIYEGIMNYRNSLPERKRKLIDWALGTGSDYNWRIYKGQKPGVLLRAKHFFARFLVINKLLAAIGLDRVQVTVTGGAPTSEKVLDFYVSVGIFLQDVYGQTENHGTTSFTTKGYIRFGSVGKPYPLTRVRVADDGEILVKGDSVSPGYYKDQQLTSETFRDGWLHSGDLGYFDEDGFLWINGRKKDIIITSGGKNITPVKIEDMLKQLPIVEYAVVAGDSRKYIAALLMINKDELVKFAERSSIRFGDYDDLLNSREVAATVDSHVQEVNSKLSRVEQIKKYRMLLTDMSVEGGELTHTMKVKRHFVLKKYKREVEEMYL